MNSVQEDFNNRLNEIRNDMVLEVSNWWGHEFAGYGGKIITNKREVYGYSFHFRTPDGEENKNSLEKIKDLSDEEYNRIIKFIEDEIANKEFEDNQIFDAGFDVVVNYNGINKKIRNNKGFGDNFGLYDKVDKLLKELM